MSIANAAISCKGEIRPRTITGACTAMINHGSALAREDSWDIIKILSRNSGPVLATGERVQQNWTTETQARQLIVGEKKIKTGVKNNNNNNNIK